MPTLNWSVNSSLGGRRRSNTHSPHHIDTDDHTREEASMTLGITTSLFSNTVEGNV